MIKVSQYHSNIFLAWVYPVVAHWAWDTGNAGCYLALDDPRTLTWTDCNLTKDVESTKANHGTQQHLSKSMIPLSPHAMLTSNFGKWICEIYSIQTSPIRATAWCPAATQLCNEGVGECMDRKFLHFIHLIRFANFPSSVPRMILKAPT